MKIFLMVAVVAVVVGVLGKMGGKRVGDAPETAPTPTTTITASRTVKYGDEEWAYGMIQVVRGKNVALIANYDRRQSSEEIMESGACETGVSGGFYREDLSPIGGVVSGGRVVKNYVKNGLFNGYLGIDAGGMKIGYGWDRGADNVVQTGPVLVWDGKIVTLSLARDKTARRVAAVGGEDTDYFLVVFGAESVLDGPRLADLPMVILEIAKKERWKVEAAINLDGGGASAFYNGEVNLKEWQPVGSWWCVRRG